MFESSDPRRAATRRRQLSATADGQKPGARCFDSTGGSHGYGRLLSRAERRSTGWRGPLPEQFAAARTKHRARKPATAAEVLGKLDRVAARLGIDA